LARPLLKLGLNVGIGEEHLHGRNIRLAQHGCQQKPGPKIADRPGENPLLAART
jgi:hypothetical protein